MDKSNFPLVYYRMPNEKGIWILESGCDACGIDSSGIPSQKTGFIIYPFTSDSCCSALFIQADKLREISPEDFSRDLLLNNEAWKIKDSSISNSYFKTKEEYCKNVGDAVEIIKSGTLQKVVLSHVKRIGRAHQSPLTAFHKLCQGNPNAFIAIVYIPGNIVWITATPELLITKKNNKIKTVSLAGTKSIENMEEWGAKEKEEQEIVTQYIRRILEKYCENIIISDPYPVLAGNVKHLKTEFSATLNSDLWNLVSALHPTPAVCGIPLEGARRFIKETEGYDRKYYAGFLGPCNVNGMTDLFVNLRCAEILTDAINLYIGGGVTKDSIPEKEWEETELKSKTLLFAFEENEK